MAMVTTFIPAKKVMPKRLRVCAYARVSLFDDGMMHSLNNQVTNFIEKIKANPQYIFCGVYHDKPMTGTKDNRPEFQKMITAARNKEVDLILTKSVSRFARNFIDTISYTRELKALGIDVFFEKEGIHSLSADGELLLSLMAAYAQAESLSISENCKWAISKRQEQGLLTPTLMLGYDFKNGTLTVNREEAVIVREIFDLYLAGYGTNKIAKILNEKGYRSKNGVPFTSKKLTTILKNEKYKGDLCLEKWYSSDHLTKTKVKNNGEKDMITVFDAHEPIVSADEFDKVQRMFVEKAKKFKSSTEKSTYPFTGKIRCVNCGANYRRKVSHDIPKWVCSTFNSQGKSVCAAKQIREDTLLLETAKVFGLKELTQEAIEQIDYIEAFENNLLVYHLTNGDIKEIVWQARSRSESWTPEMRRKVSERKRCQQ